jgi:virulence factor Mce-like protein
MGARNLQRVARTAGTVFIVAAVVLIAGSCASMGVKRDAEYCAIMPDSVGLYVGNPVTQMGVKIGAVKAISTTNSDARVDFTVTADRRLPHDVEAITRSTSVLADRSLELVGNPRPGPLLRAGECIPLTRSSTPKSLSEMIGSATTFVNSINPDGSTNVADVVRGVDQAVHNTGPGINKLLTRTSAVLDSPDQAVNSVKSVITNLAQLTSLLTELRGPVKEILTDAETTMPSITDATKGSAAVLAGTLVLIPLVSDLEVNLGDTIQFTLDAVSMTVRKAAAHAPALADLLTPVPWWISTIANHYNNRPWNLLQYRPPLYRVRTPNGVALCNIMNASTPGSCANVQGTPYAADVALLQYVLTQAANK